MVTKTPMPKTIQETGSMLMGGIQKMLLDGFCVCRKC
jgi:hypothetical protein